MDSQLFGNTPCCTTVDTVTLSLHYIRRLGQTSDIALVVSVGSGNFPIKTDFGRVGVPHIEKHWLKAAITSPLRTKKLITLLATAVRKSK